MPGGDKLVRCMREAAKKVNPSSKSTDIMYGVVQKVSPLTVLVDNRLALTEEFLILSPFCYKASFDLTVESHTHSVSVSMGKISQSDHIHQTKEDPTEAAGGFSITPSASASAQSAGGHKISVTLWDDLDIGDKLVMLRVQEGQAYLILYRDKLSVKASCQPL